MAFLGIKDGVLLFSGGRSVSAISLTEQQLQTAVTALDGSLTILKDADGTVMVSAIKTRAELETFNTARVAEDG